MGRRIAEGVGTVWVRPEDGGIEMVSFAEGDTVPKWAADQMGDHCFEPVDAPPDYSSMSKEELEAEVASRGLEAEGTKAELTKLLKANDESA